MEISQKKKTEIADEIKRLVQEYKYGTTTAEEFENILNKFSLFITSPSIEPKPLTKEELKELKQSIYKYFNVKDTEALKKSNSFKMASSSLKDLDYRKIDTWEKLYRKFIGVPPIIEPDPTPKLTKEELKESIYKYFNVKDIEALKKSNSFKMASSSLKDLDYRKIDTWERLYRKFIGILPYEVNKQEYGTINGINIFTYNRPWQVFGLDPETATTQDVKNSYRKLSKIYHPDIPNTGDANIFNRLTIFYESLTEKH
jgi:hypothetical protein